MKDYFYKINKMNRDYFNYDTGVCSNLMSATQVTFIKKNQVITLIDYFRRNMKFNKKIMVIFQDGFPNKIFKNLKIGIFHCDYVISLNSYNMFQELEKFLNQI